MENKKIVGRSLFSFQESRCNVLREYLRLTRTHLSSLSNPVKELQKDISAEQKKVTQLSKALLKTSCDTETLKRKILETQRKLEENERKSLELKQQLSASQKQVLKLKTTKNCMVNPVKLCPDLYEDVFRGMVGQPEASQDSSKLLIKWFMIGNECTFVLPRILRRLSNIKVTFGRDCKIDADKLFVLLLEDKEVAHFLIKIIAPYVKELEFDGKHQTTHIGIQRLLFQQLYRNPQQKKIKIHGIKEIDRITANAFEELHDKDVLLAFSGLSLKIMKEFPRLKYETLHIDDTKNWLQVLSKSAFSFRQLIINLGPDYSDTFKTDFNVKYVEEVVIESRPVYLKNRGKNLIHCFPKAKKLTMNGKVVVTGGMDDFDSTCNYLKKVVKNAPQKEVIVNLEYLYHKSREDSDILETFNGTKIADHTYKWTSGENKSIVVKFDHSATRLHERIVAFHENF
uniref:Uncharacterized protein n=1 Tax=Panagrolaimus sp. JU765 TaxID=591449 RepID=A0AC34R5F7_9BILA